MTSIAISRQALGSQVWSNPLPTRRGDIIEAPIPGACALPPLLSIRGVSLDYHTAERVVRATRSEEHTSELQSR